MSEDYTWSNTDDSRTVGEGALPQRYALTMPMVVRNDESEILLIDPHAPGTWNTWMLPYASLVFTSEDLETWGVDSSHAIRKIDGRSTLGQLSRALIELRSTLQERYEEAAKQGINNVLPRLEWDSRSPVLHENYSLKFSRTSDSYTAYAFQYVGKDGYEDEIDLPHTWQSAASLRVLPPDAILKDRKVSSNVVDAAKALGNNADE